MTAPSDPLQEDREKAPAIHVPMPFSDEIGGTASWIQDAVDADSEHNNTGSGKESQQSPIRPEFSSPLRSSGENKKPLSAIGLRHPTGRHGTLRLGFTKQGGRTIMTDSFFHAPLQVMKPIHHTSGCLCVYLLSPTGGVVQGDDYQIQVRLSARTHVLLTTQAATKVYRMPACGALQRIHLYVGESAIFEYLPDPIILFGDANFDQRTYLHIARGGKVVVQEIVIPGRLARGEVFAFTQYRNRIEAADENGPILYDAFCLQPDRASDFVHPGVLDGYACWGSLYLLGDVTVNASKWESLCEAADTRLNVPDRSIGGMSRLHRNGIVVRMLAHNAHTIQSAFRALWNQLRTELLGLTPVDLRKY